MSEEIRQADEATGLSLAVLLAKAKEYFLEILRFWWLILLVGAIFGGLLGYQASVKSTEYPAELTFMVNESGGGGGAAEVSVILGQFGLGGGSDSNLDKVVALAESRFIAEKMFFTKANCNGELDYIANHLMQTHGLFEEFDVEPTQEGRMFTHDSLPAFTDDQRRVFLRLHRYLKVNGEQGVPLLAISYAKASGIFTFQATSRNEDLSIAMVESLYKNLEDYYVKQATEQQQLNVSRLSEKVDSLQQLLSSTEYQLASLQDRSAGLFQQTGRVQQGRLSREVQILTIAYGESVRRLETTRFLLNNATPVFTPVDFPLSPLSPMGSSRISSAIVGALLGGILVVTFLFVRKLFADALKDS
ncbi:hypothetical protein [Neolewinella agarilytica]|uniref:Chain length determinant protein n=1 Tax=Neolewinella agarilytica TaxID=478744 RepID=A0A1H9DXP9_9BACT|nr:hypothetical protein [Neolewinella agarilytica]SEQ18241.1 hypothetical protein SAMN05444359_106172 [Neolewinella agarilytica]